jgi:hypothetical protein
MLMKAWESTNVLTAAMSNLRRSVCVFVVMVFRFWRAWFREPALAVFTMLPMLTTCGGSAPNGGTAPTAPKAQILYTVSSSSSDVRAFELDPVSPSLTPLPGLSLPTWVRSPVISIHPSGRWLYIFGNGGVELLAISNEGRSIKKAEREAWISPTETVRRLIFNVDGTLAVAQVASLEGNAIDFLMFRVVTESGELSLTRRAFQTARNLGEAATPVAFSSTGRFLVLARPQIALDQSRGAYDRTLISSHHVDQAAGMWNEAAASTLFVPGTSGSGGSDGGGSDLALVFYESFARPNLNLEENFRVVGVNDEDGSLTSSSPVYQSGPWSDQVFDSSLGFTWRTKSTFTGGTEALPFMVNRQTGTLTQISTVAVPVGYSFLFLDRTESFLFSGTGRVVCARNFCSASDDEIFVAAIDPKTKGLRSTGKPVIGGQGLTSAVLYPK